MESRSFNFNNVNGLMAPCYKCDDRSSGCHGRCDKYKQFKEENDAIRKGVLKGLHSENDLYLLDKKGRRL